MDKLFSFMHVVVACRGEEGGNNMIPEGGRERQKEPTKGKGTKATAAAHQKK